MKRILVLAAILAAIWAISAHAAQNFRNWSLPWVQIGLQTNVAIPKFTTALGTLTNVSITVNATNWYGLGIENLAPSALDASITLNNTLSLAGAISQELPTGDTFDFSTENPFDGVLDYAGASGAMVTNIEGQTLVLDMPEIAWTGPGTNYVLISTGTSGFGRGSGNYTSGFFSFVAVNISVEYDYIPTYDRWRVPCPPPRRSCTIRLHRRCY